MMKIRSATLPLAGVALCATGAAAQSPKLYVFDCGRLSFESVEIFGIGDDETDVRELAVPCYMVEHEEGRLLWDGGLPSSLAEGAGSQAPQASQAGEGGEGDPAQRLDRTLSVQLADMGLGMDSFDYVAFSHMHFDHIGVANEIEDAALIIQEPEHETAFADEVDAFAYEPELYEGLRDLEHVVVDGEYQPFGDGSVRIFPMPGHTPGHQVLYVDLENTGPVMLSGDLYHFPLSREDERVPSFNSNRVQTLSSMGRFEQLADAGGAQVWIQHDLELFEELDKAPDYYD